MVDVIYKPNTAFDYNRILNKRCGRCGLVCAMMKNTYTGERQNRYDAKTRPKDYSYAADEQPTASDYFDWMYADFKAAKRKRKASTQKTAA